MAQYHIKAYAILLEAQDDSTDGQAEILPPLSGASVVLRLPATSGTILTTAAIDNKADLVDGKVPITQLPGFVPDILLGTYIDITTFEDEDEVTYTPELDKLYIDTTDNKAYRWTGVSYVHLESGVALGETSTTAYRGDRGKTAYDHTSLTNNPHSVTKTQVGLANVDNTSDANKPISTATQTALNNKLDQLIPINTYTSNRILSLDDNFHLVEMDAAIDLEVTVPPDVFPIGSRIDIQRLDDGEVSFVAGSGVTFRSADDAVHLRVKNSLASLIQRDTNDWHLVGDLKTVE